MIYMLEQRLHARNMPKDKINKGIFIFIHLTGNGRESFIYNETVTWYHVFGYWSSYPSFWSGGITRAYDLSYSCLLMSTKIKNFTARFHRTLFYYVFLLAWHIQCMTILRFIRLSRQHVECKLMKPPRIDLSVSSGTREFLRPHFAYTKVEGDWYSTHRVLVVVMVAQVICLLL